MGKTREGVEEVRTIGLKQAEADGTWCGADWEPWQGAGMRYRDMWPWPWHYGEVSSARKGIPCAQCKGALRSVAS